MEGSDVFMLNLEPLKSDTSKLTDLSMAIKVKMDVQKQIENLFQQSLKDMSDYAEKGDIVNSDKKLDLALQYSEDIKKLAYDIGEMLKRRSVH